MKTKRGTQKQNSLTLNMRSKISTLALFIFAFSIGYGTLFAQAAGTIRGRVLDSSNGEPMFGVTAFIRETNSFSQTDIDGVYVLRGVPAGTHTVNFQIPGYQRSSSKVRVGAGRTATVNITMNFKTAKEIVVTAKRVSNTAASLLTKQKKAAAAQDAISSEQIAKSPDSDAADAAKRVTGVSILGGKYVYIRGLSERYSVVQVNRAYVPSPIPARKVVPLDVFPVSLLDNLVIAKTFLPDMPADFGAGSIQLNTKDYPAEREIKIGISVGGNTNTTFKDFQSAPGGKLDFLGFDDGFRAIPSAIPDEPKVTIQSFGNKTVEMSRDMPRTFDFKMTKGLPSGRISVGYGDTFDLGENRSFGVVASAFFSESSLTINDGKYLRYATDGTELSDYEFIESTYSTTKSAQFGTTWGLTNTDKLKLNTFYTHQSEQIGRINDGGKTGRYDYSGTGYKKILQFQSTSLAFVQLGGEHLVNLPIDGSQVNWFGAFSRADRNQPDTKSIRFTNTGDIRPAEPLTSYYNSHGENLFQFAPDISLPFNQWMGLRSKFTIGGDFAYRYRDNKSRRFNIKFKNSTNIVNQGGTAQEIFDSNEMRLEETTGTSQILGLDAYYGSLLITAGHATVDMPLVPSLRFVAGVRAEKWTQTVAGYNPFNRSDKYPNTIEGLEVLPSTNLIWSVHNDANLRLSYSRGINRPDFVESAEYRYFDDLETGAVIKGNKDLKKATIDSIDFRSEWFPSAGELVALSIFYKRIDKPIEATVAAVATELQFTFNNQEKADIYGLELELRKNLGFISSYISDFSILSNFTYAQSEIKLDPTLGSAETNTQRPLQGQSPYIINAGLYFDKEPWGTSMTLLYNIFGRRIVQVGTNTLPNVFEEPYGTLDFTASQKLGAGDIKLSLSNLLDPQITQNQGTGDTKKLIQSYSKGINFGLSYSHKL